MEYNYKNSVSAPASTVVLGELNLVIKKGDHERVVPYARITSVRLDCSQGLYQVFLAIDDQPELMISNRFYFSNGTFEDRSRTYATFVRVLHFHLKEKSHSQFRAGWSRARIQLTLGLALLVAVNAALMLALLNVSLLPGAWQPMAIVLLALGVAYLRIQPRLPRSYAPPEIPFQFLPA
ncbi:MAG: hypothetical protein MUC38_01800 [Cyclobacteriaceae bacterium]|nr:hypothetical protein [Cyclobacteriaceae bacterium]